MKIVLVGYGRMGKEIHTIATQKGHEIICRVDPIAGVGDTTKLTLDIAKSADAIIEFALPQNMDYNIDIYAQSKTPVVIGTTGWQEKQNQYQEKIISAGATLLYGSNYSIGAHLLFRLCGYAAKMVNSISDYDLMISEIHHKFKKDSPSGTALTLANYVMKNCKRKTHLVTQQLTDRAIKENELHLLALRGGSIAGTHTLILDSDVDTIEITHQARSRSGFALGAVLASSWLVNKPSGFYKIEDFMNEFIGEIA